MWVFNKSLAITSDYVHQDMTYTHKNKEILNRIRRIDITEYVRTFLLDLMKLEKRLTIRISNLSGVERIKGLMNIPNNTIFKSFSDMRSGIPYWNIQKVDYINSNIGRGYIFYFICNSCGRRVKYLYEYNMTLSPLCRTCCRLGYKSPTRKARDLSRWSKKPYLSSEDKYMLAKKFGIKKDDISDENGAKLNNKRI